MEVRPGRCAKASCSPWLRADRVSARGAVADLFRPDFAHLGRSMLTQIEQKIQIRARELLVVAVAVGVIPKYSHIGLGPKIVSRKLDLLSA